MTSDVALRTTLIVILGLIMPWAFHHRRKANRAGGVMSRREEGTFIFTLLRSSGLITWVVVFAYIIRPSSVAFAALSLPDPARWGGMVMVAAGFAWLAWMFRALGLNVTDTVVARPNGELVTSGPYRFVRHPMYAGLLPIWTGLTLVTGNWIVAVAGAVAALTLRARTRIEERNLVARYGAAYEQYKRSTGAFFPRFQSGANR
jgi:protein-S-isoprenylcysteine O-methyltransferase Ste14